MIKYILGTDLWMHPDLAQSMFRDRAKQFYSRLNWDVSVDTNGFERDEYDRINPIYVLSENEDGTHAGSLRLLPTTGRTMINDHFSSTLRGGRIHDPNTWECTRFCISPKASPRVAIQLFAAAGRLMQEFSVLSLVAVFDKSMLRKYRLSGVSPELLGEADFGELSIFAGRWNFEDDLLFSLISKSKLDPAEYELALANSSMIGSPQKQFA